MPYFENSERTVVRHSVFNDVAGDFNVYNFPNSQEEEKILAALNPAVVERKRYDVPGCMEGTRKGVFEKIDGWLNDFGAPNILWISGSPGSGKSAVASSLVSELIKRCDRVTGGFGPSDPID